MISFFICYKADRALAVFGQYQGLVLQLHFNLDGSVWQLLHQLLDLIEDLLMFKHTYSLSPREIESKTHINNSIGLQNRCFEALAIICAHMMFVSFPGVCSVFGGHRSGFCGNITLLTGFVPFWLNLYLWDQHAGYA